MLIDGTIKTNTSPNTIGMHRDSSVSFYGQLSWLSLDI